MLQDAKNNVLAKYVLSQPSLSHIMRLLPTIMQSNQHEYIYLLVALLLRAVKLLMGSDASGHAGRVTTIFLSEHLKVVYRCLSSGDGACLVVALDLLIQFALVNCAAIIRSLDFSHKGFTVAARMRKTPNENLASPRAMLLTFIMTLLERSDYDDIRAFSQSSFVFGYILDGLYNDAADKIESFLCLTLQALVLNEENNKNLAMAFLKNGKLSKIAKLLDHNNESVQQAASKFLIKCFPAPNTGLCYSTDDGDIRILRNKLLYDLIRDLNPVDNARHQTVVLETIKHCPDVAWLFLASGRLSLDPQPTLNFALSVNLAIKLLSFIPGGTVPETLLPKSISKNSLTKGLSHADISVRLATASLLLASLQRIATFSKTEFKGATCNFLPDFKTVYNCWRQNIVNDEETDLLELCFLGIVNLYIELELDTSGSDMIRTIDLCKNKLPSNDLVVAALKLCIALNPLRLLSNNDAVSDITALLKAGSQHDVVKVVSAWIDATGISNDPNLARFISQRPELYQLFVAGLYEIYSQPLIFDSPVDPLRHYLNREVGYLDYASAENLEREPVLCADPPTDEQHIIDAVVPNTQTLNSKDKESSVLASDAVIFLNWLCNQVSRNRIISSLSKLDPNTVPRQKVDEFSKLLQYLLDEFDCTIWLHVLAAALCHEEAKNIDLRALVDSGVICYAIVSLSINDIGLRRMAHLILNRYCSLLAESRVKERQQLQMVLTALAVHLSPEAPLAPQSRLTVLFHALALFVMLRPDHALYRSLNELFLGSLQVTPGIVVTRLLFDTNDHWAQCIHWTLVWLDVTIGPDGRHAVLEEFEKLHLVDNLATLTLSRGIELNTRKLAIKILENLQRQKQRPWLRTFIDLL